MLEKRETREIREITMYFYVDDSKIGDVTTRLVYVKITNVLIAQFLLAYTKTLYIQHI